MRAIVVVLIIALLGLQYKLWFSDGSISQWAKLEQKHKRQVLENEKLLARNLAIEIEISELKSGDQALEEQARYELGMIKKGEEYYQFSD
ncbi:MAG: cell division protein FtsB [Legionellales bacterium RIFCSPHIGHO2_12_FULL_35_11]|nr:MAG: cell division protein FtsB [Legionellales bacterium RIFCSPHIGHO2_12_FULL_35_11]